MVVGRSDGSLLQLDHLLKDKKAIPAPDGMQCKVFDVLWQSTTVFVVAYQRTGINHE